jgi:pyruvate/2-oxoglutarate dehydrogenase complex dihydrolipoamide acyltransferase (E2) component
MSNIVEVRMPKYPDCWETCGSCGSGDVFILEVFVKMGDVICADDAILALETGKVALDIPSPQTGKVLEVFVAEGEAVAEGQLLMTIEPV